MKWNITTTKDQIVLEIKNPKSNIKDTLCFNMQTACEILWDLMTTEAEEFFEKYYPDET